MKKKILIITAIIIVSIVALKLSWKGCERWNTSIPNAYEFKHKSDIWPKLHNGVKVNANLFVPVAKTPNEKFPAVIMICSWGMSEYEYYFVGKRLAEYGYTVLLYDPRGWYEGELEVASDNDVKDLRKAIDWVIERTPIKKDEDGKHIIIAGGISYGSVIVLRTAAVDERIRLVMALSSMADTVKAIYGNDTSHHVIYWLLTKSGNLFGKIAEKTQYYLDNATNNVNIPETKGWLSKRSAVLSIDAYNKRKIPMYFDSNMKDILFWPNQLLDFYSKLEGPKMFDMNLGDHAQCESMGLLGYMDTSFCWTRAIDFVNYHIKGIDNGFSSQPKVTMVTERSQKREAFEEWPLTETEEKTYHLTKRSRFSTGGLNENSPSEEAPASNQIRSGSGFSGISLGTPLVSAPLTSYTCFQVRTWIPGVKNSTAIVWESDKLSADLKIRGISWLDIWTEPSLKKAQLIAHLYDVNSLGVATLITHGPITLLEAEPGKPVKLSIELEVTSYDIPKGHRIAVAIDTYDPLYNEPTDKPYTLKFHYGKDYRSVLRVPVLKKDVKVLDENDFFLHTRNKKEK